MNTRPFGRTWISVAALGGLVLGGCNSVGTRSNSARGMDVRGIPSVGETDPEASGGSGNAGTDTQVRSSGSTTGTDPEPGSGTVGGTGSRSGDYRSGGR